MGRVDTVSGQPPSATSHRRRDSVCAAGCCLPMLAGSPSRPLQPAGEGLRAYDCQHPDRRPRWSTTRTSGREAHGTELRQGQDGWPERRQHVRKAGRRGEIAAVPSRPAEAPPQHAGCLDTLSRAACRSASIDPGEHPLERMLSGAPRAAGSGIETPAGASPRGGSATTATGRVAAPPGAPFRRARE